MVLNLPPGCTALLLLVVMNIAIAVISIHINKETLKWYFTKSSTPFRAKATAIIALPFWIWAIYKIIKNGDPDLGGISFALVMISCFFVMFATSQPQQNQLLKRSASIMLLISNNILACNYLFPLFVMSLPWSFNMYLVVGAVYWECVCVWNWKAHSMEATTATGVEYSSIE